MWFRPKLTKIHFDLAIAALHSHLHRIERQLMANQADVDAALDALGKAITDELAQLAAAVAASAPDLSPQVAKIQALTAQLVADDPVTTPST